MRYELLLILSALATVAAVNTATGAGIALAWPRLARAFAGLESRSRARALLALRLVPAFAAALMCILTVVAYLRHEPVSTTEVPGWMLIAGASFGASLAAAALGRVIVRCWKTRCFLEAVERNATPVTLPGVHLPAAQVETAFPLIALAGIWRSRLLVARGVLAEMPAEELEVVLQHELAHARHRDNIARLVLAALPDVLSVAERWLGIERAWREAAEDAADDCATGDDARARVCLASALVRVSRMIGEQAPLPVPLLAFHDGESIDRRVRRLVDERRPVKGRASVPVEPPFAASRSSRSLAAIIPIAAVIVLLLKLDHILLSVHEVIEWFVHA